MPRDGPRRRADRRTVAPPGPFLGGWVITAADLPDDDARPHPDAGAGPARPGTGERLKATGATALKRTSFVVVFFLIFNYVVLPSLGGPKGLGEAVERLSAVNPVLLLLALGLELAALVAYAQLTRVTLPAEPRLPLGVVLRIQLATKAVSHLVPGGSAAGSTLGYRLLTQAGVDGAAAGFSLATVGLGSAVVLNLLLWLALLVSIPLDGFNPVYGTAAIVGMLLLALFAGLVVLLMRGREPAVRVVRSVADKLPLVQPDTAERFVRVLVSRLQELIQNPSLIRRGIIWATANWLLDAAALWVFIRAFGPTLNPVDVIVAFCVANLLAVIPITPGGLGWVEVTLTTLLVGFSLDRSTATVAVLTYRLAQFWLPIPLGAAGYASLRVGPGSIRKMRSRHPIRDLTGDTVDTAGVRVWDVDDTPSPDRS